MLSLTVCNSLFIQSVALKIKKKKVKKKRNKKRPILLLLSLMGKFIGTEVTMLLTITLAKPDLFSLVFEKLSKK